MDLLIRGDIDGYRQLKKNALSEVLFTNRTLSSSIAQDLLDKSKMRKTLSAVDEQGNNILHSLVHLEQFETLKYEPDELESLLTEELDSLFPYLGPRKFLQLLVQENNHGVSSVQKAALSKGPAYEALRTVVQRRSHSFRSGFLTGAGAMGYAIGGSAIFNADIHMITNASGIVFTALGLGYCYTAFSKYRPFNKINRELSYPVDL